jgi:thioredoxin-like negative regulator of GroEL
VESEFLPYVTGSKYVVCHFYHNDFERCKIVDHHLRQIAKQHPEAKFIYLNAEKAPFFVDRLAVKVLPTIVTFIDGIANDRIVGF